MPALHYTAPEKQEGKTLDLEAMVGKKVLVIGGGGREHAIVDAISRSPRVGKIYCAPGNAGIAAQAECVAIKDTDVKGLLAFAQSEGIDLTVVGPEAALAAGVVDEFRAAGLKIFGHTVAATRIESSKEFAKEIMAKYGVPTADYRSFSDYDEALAYVSGRPFPAVLKYDGLAAGKGVVIAETLEEADAALKDMLLDAAFGKGKVVVEDYLTGPEFSFMCFVDGARVYPMPLAQDHKRAFDGDKGPNTGGMGAYTGLPFVDDADVEFALENVLRRTAEGMVAEGCPLSGVLYGGLMKTPAGVKVIEFNARFGDPETEVVLPLIESDILDVFEAVASGVPCEQPVWADDYVTMGVVMASKGYPGSYQKGFEIRGIENCASVYHMGTKAAVGAAQDGGCVSFQAGGGASSQVSGGVQGGAEAGRAVQGVEAVCAVQSGGAANTEDGQVFLTNGGRVLMVVAKAKTIAEARELVYADVRKISCDNLFYRNDIAHWAL